MKSSYEHTKGSNSFRIFVFFRIFVCTLFVISYLFVFSYVIALAQSDLPSITIHSAIDGQKYNNEVVEFDIGVKDFTFVDFKNNTVLYPADPDAGHAHVWIESRLTGEGDNLSYKLLSADFHEVGELDPGNYRLTIELVRNNEEQFEPRIFSTVTFSVGSEGIQGSRYSIKNRVEQDITYAPPRTVGVSERSVAGIIFIAILIVLYAIFRKKLERYTFFRKLNTLLTKIYVAVKRALTRVKRKITKK